MTEQPALFDATRHVPKACPVRGCGAILTAGQQRVTTCVHDLEPPDDRPYRRPRGCLNTHNPSRAPFPAGF